jgi:urease accessory protein
MTTTTGALSTVLLLGDGRLPTGGHTQSNGLEPALSAGLDPAHVPGLLRTRLRTATLVDAATAVVARHLLLTSGETKVARLAWEARTPSQVTRAASIDVGRAYARVLARLGHPLSGHQPRPIALASLGVALDVSAESLARLVCHDDVQSICSAALKLLPLDPLDTVAWALDAAPEVEGVVAAVTPLTDPDDIPAPSAPAAELWQHAHARSTRRLFRA